MRTFTTAAIAIAATALVAVPVTALITASNVPPRVEVVTHTVPVEDTASVDAYGEAVKELRAAGERGDDLLPYLIELAEVDNNIRFGG